MIWLGKTQWLSLYTLLPCIPLLHLKAKITNGFSTTKKVSENPFFLLVLLVESAWAKTFNKANPPFSHIILDTHTDGCGHFSGNVVKEQQNWMWVRRFNCFNIVQLFRNRWPVAVKKHWAIEAKLDFKGIQLIRISFQHLSEANRFGHGFMDL